MEYINRYLLKYKIGEDMARKISIEADSLKKIYKNREVVKSVSLSMEKGEVVGLLGKGKDELEGE